MKNTIHVVRIFNTGMEPVEMNIPSDFYIADTDTVGRYKFYKYTGEPAAQPDHTPPNNFVSEVFAQTGAITITRIEGETLQ